MKANEVSVTRLHDGSLEVSAIVNGYRAWMRYFGYTKRQAVALFLKAVSK